MNETQPDLSANLSSHKPASILATALLLQAAFWGGIFFDLKLSPLGYCLLLASLELCTAVATAWLAFGAKGYYRILGWLILVVNAGVFIKAIIPKMG